MIKKLLLIVVVFFGLISIAQSENSWIKKKDKSENIEKTEKIKKKEKTSWIKKKIKENKKEYKKEEKKITKKVKSWIKKKSKVKYLTSIKDLPNGAIYFQAYNDSRSSLIYGFVLPDTDSKIINGYHEHSEGYAYFNDGKTTCKVGSTVKFASSLGEVISQISGECTNGIKFTGSTTQEGNSGSGSAKTADGKERYFVDVDKKKTEIAKSYEKNKSYQNFALANETQKEIELKPNGKYYALLIGNSKYINWTSLKSPKNDVKEIANILDKKYNFDVTTVIDGTYKKIFKAFNDLSKKTTDIDYVLIYYAGHGEIIGDRSFWIPADAEKEAGLGDWINISDIEYYLEKKIPAHHLAVMVDSCYFAVSQKGSQNYSQENLLFKKYLKDRARIVLASGTNQPVDDTNKGSHSLFGFTFIKSLEANKYAINLLKIRDDLILAHSNKRQQPFGHGMRHWGHNGGDFVFIVKK